MKHMYIYENHLGGIYWSNSQLDYDDLYCDECGDSDSLIGEYDPDDIISNNNSSALSLIKELIDHCYSSDYIAEKICSYFNIPGDAKYSVYKLVRGMDELHEATAYRDDDEQNHETANKDTSKITVHLLKMQQCDITVQTNDPEQAIAQATAISAETYSKKDTKNFDNESVSVDIFV